MRARNALTGRGEEAEVIGGPLRAEGCWTFDARDRMPRSSPLTAHPLTATAENAPASTPPSRETGFVRCPQPVGGQDARSERENRFERLNYQCLRDLSPDRHSDARRREDAPAA